MHTLGICCLSQVYLCLVIFTCKKLSFIVRYLSIFLLSLHDQTVNEVSALFVCVFACVSSAVFLWLF